MTVIHFKKKLPCGKTCHEDFTKKVKELYPTFEDSVNAHITIYHEKPVHEIWCTFYDKGKHENFSKLGLNHHKIISTEFSETWMKKYKGKIPTEKELMEISIK